MLEALDRERRATVRRALRQQPRARAMQSALVTFQVNNWIARYEQAKGNK